MLVVSASVVCRSTIIPNDNVQVLPLKLNREIIEDKGGYRVSECHCVKYPY